MSPLQPYEKADPDLTKGHRLLQERWPRLKAELEGRHNIGRIQVIEVYRPDIRQQWLYGKGRTVEQCVAKGVPPGFSQPLEKIVTGAWSASVGAHGWTENGQPASCALDVVPVGADGKPWTADDNFAEFVRLTDDVLDLGGQIGLVHFHSPGKDVWDKPHLQLIEYSDAEHRLILPDFSRAGSGTL